VTTASIPIEHYLGHFTSDSLVPCTTEFHHLAQLYHIIVSGGLPLYYFKAILQWAQAGVRSGAISGTSTLPKRESFVKELTSSFGTRRAPRQHSTNTAYYRASVLLENDSTRSLVKGINGPGFAESEEEEEEEEEDDYQPTDPRNFVSVYHFSFRSVLIDLLSDVDLFSDPSNLVFNNTPDPEDRFLPFKVTSSTPLHEIPSAGYYQLLAQDPKFASGGCFLLPIILYGDSTLVDWMGKYSVEPWIFTLGIFKEKVRRSSSHCWRPLGLRPVLSGGGGTKQSPVNMRNGHRCLQELLSEITDLSSKLVEMDRSSLPIEVEEGLGRQSAVAEAILWAEQETRIVMFAISCLLLANYKSLHL
jgi:hypothetical protein